MIPSVRWGGASNLLPPQLGFAGSITRIKGKRLLRRVRGFPGLFERVRAVTELDRMHPGTHQHFGMRKTVYMYRATGIARASDDSLDAPRRRQLLLIFIADFAESYNWTQAGDIAAEHGCVKF